MTAFDLKAGTFTFYRPKVDKVQTHRMTPDTVRAVAAWLHTDAPAMGSMLRGSRKGGALTELGMSGAITARVAELGAGLGIAGLSAHDCRHSWATRASKGKDAFALRDAAVGTRLRCRHATWKPPRSQMSGLRSRTDRRWFARD